MLGQVRKVTLTRVQRIIYFEHWDDGAEIEFFINCYCLNVFVGGFFRCFNCSDHGCFPIFNPHRWQAIVTLQLKGRHETNH